MKITVVKLKSFSLLEVIVAMALFIMITLSILEIFSRMIQAQYEIYDMQTLQNNAQYLMEVISKESRMARKDEDGSCVGTAGRAFFTVVLGGVSQFKFLNYKGECIHYRFELAEKKIYKKISGGSQISVTSSDVDVESAEFVHLDDMVSGMQPIVYIKAVLSNPNYEDESKKIKVQTTISARVYP